MDQGLFGRLFSIFRLNKTECAKRRLLKRLGRDLAGSRFSRFYKPRLQEVQPAMGKFFWDIYKTLSYAQVFLQDAAESARLKQVTVEAFLDLEHMDARQRLNAGHVEEKAMSITEASRLLKEDLAVLADAFDINFISRVNACYNQILLLIRFVNFNYFFFLQKFNSSLVERNFNIVPQFKPVWGGLLLEEIKDFLEISCPIDPDLDWSRPLQILRKYKNSVDVLTVEEWARLMGALRELRRFSVLELMVRHISQEPQWEFNPRIPQERIAAAYLDERRKEVDQVLAGLLYTQKQSHVAALSKELFGDPAVRRLLYYTEEDGEAFAAKGLNGFIHAKRLNYLKAFLADFFQEDIQALCELLLVQGLWASIEQSKAVSELFHILLNNMNRLQAFEQSLSEGGGTGSRLRVSLTKASRGRSQLRSLEHIVQQINAEALDLLRGSTEALILLGKCFKEILRTSERDRPLIVNFRELQLKEKYPPLVDRIVLAYKQIYNYLRIQQILASTE
jgi:hypothetical protein